MSAAKLSFVALFLAAAVVQGCTGSRWGSALSGFRQDLGRAVTRTFDPDHGSRERTMFARSAVFVRSGPGTKHSRLGVLGPGDEVPVVGASHGWYRVRYGSGHGWVGGRYLADTATAIVGNAPPSRSENRPRVATAETTHRPAASDKLAPAAIGAPVEVAGIPFRWGMSRAEARRLSASGADHVEKNGAVWLRTATFGEGTPVPEDWIDLSFCDGRLCAIRRVINAVSVETEIRVGDLTAAELVSRHGKPRSDTWEETAFGRMRVRTWNLATARIRLTHQDEQTYAAIHYLPIDASPSEPARPNGGAGRIVGR